jgi:hypothetical protein
MFFGVESEQDNNLQFVRDMLTKRAPEPVAVMQTYRQVWWGKPAVVDDERSLVKSHLKLAGVVKRVGKGLAVRNPIYRRVFDGRWINSDLAPFSTSHFLDEKARLEARETAQNPVTDIGARSE